MPSSKADDRPLIPLHDDTGDLDATEDAIEDAEDVWSGIANSPGVSSIRTNGNPDNDRIKSLVLAVLDDRELSRLQR